MKAHLISIYQKFNIRYRAAAVAVAAQKGLLEKGAFRKAPTRRVFK